MLYSLKLDVIAFLGIPTFNIALNKPVEQSSSLSSKTWAKEAVNGDYDDFSHTGTFPNQWWKIDLLRTYEIQQIILFNRHGFCKYCIFYNLHVNVKIRSFQFVNFCSGSNTLLKFKVTKMTVDCYFDCSKF